LPKSSAKTSGFSIAALLRIARREGWRFGLGVLALGGTTALGLAIPWSLARAVDALHRRAPDALSVTGQSVLFIVTFASLQAAFRTTSRILIFNAARDVEYNVRTTLFAHLLKLPQSFYQRHPTGDLMSRMTNDVTAVRMLFGAGVLNFANTLIVYVATVVLMVNLSGRLTAVALIPLPIVITLAQLSSRRIYHASRELQDEMGRLSTHLQEDLAGITTLRAYGLEALRSEKFEAKNQAYLRRSLQLVRTRGILGPLFAITGGIGTLIVLWMGGHEVLGGRMTVGQLVAFNAYLAYLAWPTLALGWVLSLWQRGLAGWSRIAAVLETPAEAQPETASIPARQPILEARNLKIEREGRTVIHDVSFRLAPGETLAIVGGTGGGKSTLCDAILRLCEVGHGQLFLDNVDVRELKLSDLRRICAYAPQDAFLFSATIDENIAFGSRREDPSAGARNARLRAAQTAGLSRDLKEFPAGIDTVVGERGITLSGGQRQRVALARALAADGQLLILDDALSSVDAETEREILLNLIPIMKNRSTIIVSHRVAAVAHADEILVLEGGRVVARGKHADLSMVDGPYARLYREQLGESNAARAAGEVA